MAPHTPTIVLGMSYTKIYVRETNNIWDSEEFYYMFVVKIGNSGHVTWIASIRSFAAA